MATIAGGGMIAVDALGGDFAPHVVVCGAVAAARAAVPIALFGPEQILHEVLDNVAGDWRNLPISLRPTSQCVTMDDEPVDAVRAKRDSSLVKAVLAVHSGDAAAVVSAGNSGALLAASTLILGRVDGIDRPAIVGLLPIPHGVVVALDLGANVDCKPHHLVQFAHMGSRYAANILNIKNPRVGLLANGTEASKGTALTKAVFKDLETSGLHFVGNVEPYEVVRGTIDVMVTDGFTGNIMLKTIEAVVAVIREKSSTTETAASENLMHIRTVGGAPLLGVNGTVIVAHGSSSSEEIEQAVMLAWRMARAA